MNAATTARVIVRDDFDADTSYLDQEGLGFEDRREAYRNGDFGFVGLFLEAEVRVPAGPGHWIIQTITSPGLWGIESDSDHDYFLSVAHDEYHALSMMLAEMNCTIPIDLDRELRYR